MRDSYEVFKEANIKIVAVSQDAAEDVKEYFSEHSIPFVCLPDPDAKLKTLYNQQAGLAPLPALFVIDTNGIILLAHYGDGMSDIPTIDEILKASKK